MQLSIEINTYFVLIVNYLCLYLLSMIIHNIIKNMYSYVSIILEIYIIYSHFYIIRNNLHNIGFNLTQRHIKVPSQLVHKTLPWLRVYFTVLSIKTHLVINM